VPFSHHGSGGEGDGAEYRGWARERSVAGWERGRCRKGPTERARREGVGPSKPTPYRRTLGGRGVLLARTGRPMKRLPKREVASAPEAPAPARACAGKRGRDLGPAPSTIDTVRMHGQNAQHQHAHPNPAAGPPNPGWPAHGHELWPAHASGRSERRRAGGVAPYYAAPFEHCPKFPVRLRLQIDIHEAELTAPRKPHSCSLLERGGEGREVGDRAAARMQDLELFDPSSLELLDRSPAVVRTVAGARGGYQNDLGVFAPR